MTARPFFNYYGGKWRDALRYPAPAHDRIVEPFAGSAGYATRYAHLDVALYDASPVVAGVWEYLIATSAAEIRRLPLQFDHVDELTVSPEARDLIGFWLNKGVAAPRRSPSAWMRSGIRPGSFWGAQVRERIAGQVDRIRHWTVACVDYSEVPVDRTATWFVDPPYDDACGEHYAANVEDFHQLGRWCEQLPGQVIVCERAGADWLPFVPLHQSKAMHGEGRSGVSAEAIWMNGPDPGRLDGIA